MGLEDAIVGFIIGVALITASVTAALVFGAPWFWQIIKSWLHAVTA